MSDDILIDTSEKDKRKTAAFAASIVLAVMGIFVLLTYRSYLDIGHAPVFVVYAMFNFLLFRCLKKAKIVMALISIVMITIMLGLAIVKINWNKDYLYKLTTSDAFMFEDYIERYPRLEEYYFGHFFGQPDWIRFANQCALPALRKQPVHSSCRDVVSIQRKYNISINDEINNFMARMQRTALRVKEGRLKSGVQYQACLAKKDCAPIPLLPENVDAKLISDDVSQYTDVRIAFWDLAERRGLTLHVCGVMILCQAMVYTGALKFNAPSITETQ